LSPAAITISRTTHYSSSITSNSIVANLSIPFYIGSMTYDPLNGMIYGGGWNGTYDGDVVLAFSASEPSSVTSTVLSDVNFRYIRTLGPGPIVFDPGTNALIVPGNSDTILAVNPLTDVTSTVASLASAPVTISIALGGNQIFVSTFDPSSVLVLNGTSYDQEGQIFVSDCIDNICAEPNEVNQVLVDPSHGNLYLESAVATIAVNLSGLSTVGTIEDYGDGPSASSVYVPTADRIFGTYSFNPEPNPGFLVQLDHITYLVVTSLVWLPASVGTLGIGGIAGLVLSVIMFERYRKTPPPPRRAWPRREVFGGPTSYSSYPNSSYTPWWKE